MSRGKTLGIGPLSGLDPGPPGRYPATGAFDAAATSANLPELESR
ncbi:MAG: hypothetical protein ACRDYA_18540 [Egibacteraceae bacterium]